MIGTFLSYENAISANMGLIMSVMEIADQQVCVRKRFGTSRAGEFGSVNTGKKQVGIIGIKVGNEKFEVTFEFLNSHNTFSHGYISYDLRNYPNTVDSHYTLNLKLTIRAGFSPNTQSLNSLVSCGSSTTETSVLFMLCYSQRILRVHRKDGHA